MTATPTEAQIQAIADTLLADARDGTTRPSISALADRAGITRPTLYRNFPDVIARFRAESATAEPTTLRRNTAVAELRERITNLRHENEQLRLHVELYEEHIRRLTVENTRLAAELAQQHGVAHLANHRNGRPATASHEAGSTGPAARR